MELTMAMENFFFCAMCTFNANVCVCFYEITILMLLG